MRIVSNDAFCSRINGTVRKFIIIRISGNQIPVNEWLNKLYRWYGDKEVGNIISNFTCSLFFQHFPIFIENIITDT